MTEPGTIHPSKLRTSLLDQLAYLIDEVEALKAVIDRVPEPLLVAHPPGQELSVKEAYGLLATLDTAAHLPHLRQMIAEDEPAFAETDGNALATQAGWNDQPMADILERVQQARTDLLMFLRALPSTVWTRTGRFGATRHDVYGLAHHITQHDVDLLRAIGYRLYEGNLGRKGNR